jgi:23S rRNA G2445 N2-methylase RlmL
VIVELRPRLYPDPRLGYRKDDIAAASHPPLAACMARLAKQASPDSEEPRQVVWDPFCGSGLELIERSMLGGVRAVHGTDLDPAAIGIARANFKAAGLENVSGMFTPCDFRDAEKLAGIAPGSITLVITNPPLGRRVRVKDMRGLIADLLLAASKALEPGGPAHFHQPAARWAKLALTQVGIPSDGRSWGIRLPARDVQQARGVKGRGSDADA